MQNPLFELEARITQTTAARDRSATLTLAGATVLFSQLVLMAKTAPDPDAYDYEAGQLAEGVVKALSAPMVYAAAAVLLVFGIRVLFYGARHRALMAERAQLLNAAPDGKKR